MTIDIMPLITTLKLSFLTTLILLVVCFPISLFLGFCKSKFIPFLESILTLPLVLPPTVIGFYLLLLFSPRWIIGSFFENVFNIRIVFSFSGIVIASCIYSLPFMIQPLKNGFQYFDKKIVEASYILGKNKLTTLIRVIIPNLKTSILTGIVMTFAHTMGEFGVVLMIGGNITGVTKVASIAIYDSVEKLDYNTAHAYSLALVITSLIILIIVNSLNNNGKKEVYND